MASAELAAFSAGALAVLAVAALGKMDRPTTGRKRSLPVALALGLGRELVRVVGSRGTQLQMQMQRLAEQAAIERRLGGRDIVALKLLLLVGGAIFGLTLGLVGFGPIAGFLTFVAPAAGFLMPDIALRRRARNRRAEIARDLPGLLDLMRIGVAAGMPLPRALEVAGRYFEGPLADESHRIYIEHRLGTSFRRALELFAGRCQLAEIDEFVAAVQRSMRHGTSLSATLARQAKIARDDRQRQVREAAAKSGPKIQLVVALVLVPSILLLFAAALLTQFGEQLGGSLSIGG